MNPAPSNRLAELQRELAERLEQLANRWGVSSEQVQRVLHLVSDRLPDYTDLEFIGAGGMGEVWKARHRTLERPVAIKLITPDATGDPNFTERFLREARILAELDHPHIVRVYDFGELDGFFYLVMEYVPSDLNSFLQARQKALADGTAANPPLAVLRFLIDLCGAVEYAHARGVLHRDIKPGNVLWSEDVGAKLADFGLARRVEGYGESARLTATNEVVGTFAYMAPEQLTNPAEVDRRADIYSLGVVLYELLTGNLPRGHFEPPSVRVGDKRFDAVIARALAPDPARRYASAGQMQADLIRIRDNPPTTIWATLGSFIWPAWMFLLLVLNGASLWSGKDISSFAFGMLLTLMFGLGFTMPAALPRLHQPGWALACLVCVLANWMGPAFDLPRDGPQTPNLTADLQLIAWQMAGFLGCCLVILPPLAERASSLLRAAVLMYLVLMPPFLLALLSVSFRLSGYEAGMRWMPLALLLLLIVYIEIAARQRTKGVAA